jgi:hypothetical protein
MNIVHIFSFFLLFSSFFSLVGNGKPVAERGLFLYFLNIFLKYLKAVKLSIIH